PLAAAASPAPGLGPLTLVPTVHLHLFFKSYRLFRTGLGTLRAQANRYARHLLAWVEAFQAGPAPDSGSAGEAPGPPDMIAERLTAIAQAWRQGRAADSVRQAFARVLERPVDEAGMLAYAAALGNGYTERQLVRELALCEEHLHYFVHQLNVYDAVYKLYDHILARPSDPHGLEHCLSILQTVSPEAAAENLLQSD